MKIIIARKQGIPFFPEAWFIKSFKTSTSKTAAAYEKIQAQNITTITNQATIIKMSYASIKSD